MLFLSAADVLRVAGRILGPAVAIRDIGLIEAASARPQTTVNGEYAYQTVAEMAAALTQSIVTNHALVDGNKRLGLACLLVFLRMNGHRPMWTNDEAYELIYGIADGTFRTVEEIAVLIKRGI